MILFFYFFLSHLSRAVALVLTITVAMTTSHLPQQVALAAVTMATTGEPHHERVVANDDAGRQHIRAIVKSSQRLREEEETLRSLREEGMSEGGKHRELEVEVEVGGLILTRREVERQGGGGGVTLTRREEGEERW